MSPAPKRPSPWEERLAGRLFLALSPTLPAALRDLVRECLAPAAARPSVAEVADRITSALG